MERKKRYVFKYVGGSLDGHVLDTDSSDQEEKKKACFLYEQTGGAQLGKGHSRTTKATMLGQVSRATAEKYYITDSKEEDNLVTVTLTFREKMMGKGRPYGHED